MKIAVIISESRYDIQSQALKGILEEAQKESVDVYIFTCNTSTGYLASGSMGAQGNDFMLLRYADYDGFIFYCDTIPDRKMVAMIAGEIKKTGVPALTVKDNLDGMLCLGIDNSAGIRSIIRHLVQDLKKRRIYFITGPKYNTDARERLAAYRETMSELGIDPEEDWIAYGDFHPHCGRVILHDWVQKRKECGLPEAIVCSNDEMAMGVCQEAEKLGIKIPGDIAVSGFDNRLISILVEPTLSTVDLPGHEIGVCSAKKLFNALFHREDNIPSHISTRTILRRSTEPQLTEDSYAEAVNDLRTFYITDRTHTSNLLDAVRKIETDFADAASWDDFYQIIQEHIGLFEAEAFYLFTPKQEIEPDDSVVLDLLSGRQSASLNNDSEMSVAVAWENGKLKDYPPFKAVEMIPEEILKHNGHGYYVVYPLFHEKEMLGYCVAFNSPMAYGSEWFALFIQLVSSAMENLRRKAQLSHMVDTLNHLWIYDKLTGAYNRAGYAENADRILHDARHSGAELSVLFADLDRLKYVNDNFGHDAGDSFICEIAGILKQEFEPCGIVVRFGGDEFVAITGKLDGAGAEALSRKIQDMIGDLNRSGRYDFPISASCGTVTRRASEIREIEDLIEEADQLMYAVKAEKKRLMKE